MSRIIALSSPKIKRHRNSERTPGRFGAGLTRYAGQYDGRRSYTEDEVRWAASVFGQTWDEDEVLEQRALEAREMDRIERGWVL